MGERKVALTLMFINETYFNFLLVVFRRAECRPTALRQWKQSQSDQGLQGQEKMLS